MHELMSIYQKRTLPVQFLQFGVDTKGVIVPILKRDKDPFVKLRPVIRPAERKIRVVSGSR